MIATDVNVHHIPDIYRRFASEIGESRWRKVGAVLRQEMKGNSFLHDYLHREYSVVFQLNIIGDLVARYGGLPASVDDIRLIYPAAAFMSQVLSLIDTWPKADGEKLRHRVFGALKNPPDLRGLQLEFSVATHFGRRGWTVDWPETLAVPDESFDHLVALRGAHPLEVECKSIGEDKGCRITRRETLEFYKVLNPYLKPITQGLTGGLSVVVTVPHRLPTNFRDRQALAKSIGESVLEGSSRTFADGCSIRMADFDVASLGFEPQNQNPKELRTVIDGITATRNRSAVLIGCKSGGALVLALQSLKDDLLLKATFDTLSDAVSRQLTGKRAGMVIAAFIGLTGDELLEVASDDQHRKKAPSKLQIEASTFLASTRRDNLVGLAFFSNTGLKPVDDGLVDAASGTAYYFPKRESAFWSESFSGLFKPM